MSFYLFTPADNHIPAVQQHRSVDVRLVYYAELDKPRTTIAFHGLTILGTAVQDIIATSSFLQVPFGCTYVTNLAKVI